jgi:hypothetical protein
MRGSHAAQRRQKHPEKLTCTGTAQQADDGVAHATQVGVLGSCTCCVAANGSGNQLKNQWEKIHSYSPIHVMWGGGPKCSPLYPESEMPQDEFHEFDTLSVT